MMGEQRTSHSTQRPFGRRTHFLTDTTPSKPPDDVEWEDDDETSDTHVERAVHKEYHAHAETCHCTSLIPSQLAWQAAPNG